MLVHVVRNLGSDRAFKLPRNGITGSNGPHKLQGGQKASSRIKTHCSGCMMLLEHATIAWWNSKMLCNLNSKMMTFRTLIWWLLLVALSCISHAERSISTDMVTKNLTRHQDVIVMRHLKYSLQIRNFYWRKSSDPCSEWRGVQCENGHVVGLHLSGLKRSAVGMRTPSFAMEPARKLKLLRYINASHFVLLGSIPDWLGELSKLEVLDLSSCSIYGSIPDSLGQLSDLRILSLSRNNVTGGMPASIWSLKSLTSLDLSSNILVGSFPAQIGGLANLSSLDLSCNALSGAIPQDLGKLRNLTTLNLAFNNLNGDLPPNIMKCSALQEVKLSNNFFHGKLSLSFSRLQKLVILDLSHNNFTGLLPSDLLELRSIEILVLSHNQFYGPLPGSVAGLEHLTTLDISNNFLNGSLPAGFFPRVSLDTNCFWDLPRQRYTSSCRLFYAAHGLTFHGMVGLLPLGVIATKPGVRSRPDFPIVGGIFGSLAFIISIVTLVLLKLKLKHERELKMQIKDMAPPLQGGETVQQTSSMPITVNKSCMGDAFSYERIQRATQNFSPANFLKAGHSGDLYRGQLDGGPQIVVKRVDVSSVKRDLLMAELEVFGKASHTRLIPLLGHCLECEDEKFLVYKYMPYGDLEQSLHRKVIPSPSKDIVQSLDWITRLKIAVGTAEGLSYLHHECSPSLVHRGIMASSILLDDKFEVRIGSLSDVRTQEGGLQPGLITRLLRKSQTSEQGDPDSPVASCAYDVYCFGKILLELVTGKLGISNPLDPNADAWLDWALPLIDRHDKEPVTKLIDPSLIVDEDLLEEVWAVAIIAKLCLNPKPSKRPAMKQILKALEYPQRVVREEGFSASLRRSSQSSWNASLFGSWRHSSSETVIPGCLKEENQQEGNRKHSGGSYSQGSLQGEHSHHRRPGSSEIFPEPFEGTQQDSSLNV